MYFCPANCASAFVAISPPDSRCCAGRRGHLVAYSPQARCCLSITSCRRRRRLVAPDKILPADAFDVGRARKVNRSLGAALRADCYQLDERLEDFWHLSKDAGGDRTWMQAISSHTSSLEPASQL